jgi:hypothetical protein
VKRAEKREATQRRHAYYELLIAIVIVAIVLIPQVVGTTTVSDPTKGLNEDGCPTTTKTLTDLEVAGTRFGTLTKKEWEDEILRRFPQGEIRHYNSFSNCYTGLESGEIDASMGFIDEQKALAETHPDLAFIAQPFATVDCGFGVQKSERGDVLCDELNQFLSGRDILTFNYEYFVNKAGSLGNCIVYAVITHVHAVCAHTDRQSAEH